MTEETRLTPEELAALRKLIARAHVVLWDFDGPICRLFAGHPAPLVKQELVDWLKRQGLYGLVTEEERKSRDPQVLLRAVNDRHPDSDLFVELEERLTQQELRAVPTAMPTPYADPLIRTLTAVGIRLAVTTNNSPRAVREYLADRGLLACFDPHVYGRSLNLDLLKPNPHFLNRALRVMGAAPSDALMIGDTPFDYEAARNAGVAFVGYARNDEKRKLLRDAGASVVVGHLGLGEIRAMVPAA